MEIWGRHTAQTLRTGEVVRDLRRTNPRDVYHCLDKNV